MNSSVFSKKISNKILELINDKNKREELSKNIKLFGNPSASAKIADFAENIIG